MNLIVYLPFSLQIIFLQLLRDVLEDHECMEQLCDQKEVSGSVEGISLSVADGSDNDLSEAMASSSVEGICRTTHNESTVLWDLLHTIGNDRTEPLRSISIYEPYHYPGTTLLEFVSCHGTLFVFPLILSPS